MKSYVTVSRSNLERFYSSCKFVLILECLSIVVMRFGHQFVEGLNSSSEVLLGSLIQLLAYMTTIFIFYFYI